MDRSSNIVMIQASDMSDVGRVHADIDGNSGHNVVEGDDQKPDAECESDVLVSHNPNVEDPGDGDSVSAETNTHQQEDDKVVTHHFDRDKDDLTQICREITDTSQKLDAAFRKQRKREGVLKTEQRKLELLQLELEQTTRSIELTDRYVKAVKEEQVTVHNEVVCSSQKETAFLIQQLSQLLLDAQSGFAEFVSQPTCEDRLEMIHLQVHESDELLARLRQLTRREQTTRQVDSADPKAIWRAYIKSHSGTAKVEGKQVRKMATPLRRKEIDVHLNLLASRHGKVETLNSTGTTVATAGGKVNRRTERRAKSNVQETQL